MTNQENHSRRPSHLSPAKQAILERWKRGERVNRPELDTIPWRLVQSLALLSFAQQRLWFLEQLEPGNAAYTMPYAIHLRGVLDVEALQRSIQEIISRHEILRTTFAIVDEKPVQVIASTFNFELPVNELEFLPGANKDTYILELAQEAARQPFDLSKGPLIRAVLLQLAEEEHVLLLTMHHIVSDRWSVAIVLRELALLYDAFITGDPSPLHELPIQYADYAHWQRQWLQGDRLETQLAYWKRQLANAPARLNLPTDHPRPAVQTFQGANQAVEITKSLTESLKNLSQRESTTLFMTLLAAFMVLLSRYTGQDDVVVGSPASNRSRTETEELIGCFLNTLVLRGDLSGDLSFRELLRRVRNLALDAYDHQDLPFEKLVEELQPERDLSRNPLFDVWFILQNESGTGQDWQSRSITMNATWVGAGTAQFDLSLLLSDTPTGLKGFLEYRTDLFDSLTIARMIEHLQIVLHAVVAAPDQRLSDLPFLTQTELQQLLVEWNATHVDYPGNVFLHQLIEVQAERTPERIAVVCEDTQLNYRELNSRANQLAHLLLGLGVGPEVLVGICAERSLELIVELLGILKAGGGYVPLDPSYPRDRLSFMLQDAQIDILLTLQRHVEDLPKKEGIRVICLDTGQDEIACESEANPISMVSDENIVYTIYTSGSTGRPKGAMNTHRGVANRLLWMQDTYRLTDADSVLQKTSCSFDVSVWEFFWPLIAGARLVLAEAGGQKDSAYLVDLIVEQRVTVLHFVPSMLRAFLAEGGINRCSSIRYVICSGEALPADLREEFFRKFDAELYNLYGPTEASIDVTCWKCERASDQQVVPIGRPIANTQIYLLNSHLQPVPLGSSGEVYIGGTGLARGYLNAPELTAEKFVPNLFSAIPGTRLYKTGDLARYLPDGNVDFLGRIDHQVKVRGFRIELGEIETAIAKHPSVRENVVLAREDLPGEKRLVAYIVANQASALTVSDLRHFLKERLPEYMIPSVLITLENLPLMENGKVNRRALSAPSGIRPETRELLVAPSSPTEELLAAIWREVLHLDQVGVQDNFFDLGGDSIVCIQILTRANQAGLQLTTKHLFQYQTISELAAAAQTYLVTETSQNQVVSAPAHFYEQLPDMRPDIEDVYPLSPLQEHRFFRYLFSPEYGLYLVRRTYTLHGDLNFQIFQQVWQMLVDRHAILRTSFIWEDVDEPRQVVHKDVKVVLEFRDWRTLSSDKQEEALKIYLDMCRIQGLQLTKPTPIRMLVAQIAENRYEWVVNLNYMCVDGWSLGLLLNDFFTYYEALSDGQQPAVEVPTPYKNYIHWAKAQSLMGAEAFWKRMLVGFSPTTYLANHFSERAQNQHEDFDCRHILLSSSATEGLKVLARQHQLTLNVLILGAWTLLLSYHSQKRDVAFGITSSGRPTDLAGVESMVGLMINVLPTRMQVDPQLALWPWLNELQGQQIELRDYEFVSLSQIHKWAQVPENTLMFDSLLIFQNLGRIVSTINRKKLTLMNTTPLFYAKTEYPLRVDIFPGEEISIFMSYYRCYFDDATIDRLLKHLQVLLEGISVNVRHQLGDLLRLLD